MMRFIGLFRGVQILPAVFWQDMDTDKGVDIQSTIDKHCTLRMPCFAHTLQLVVKDGLGKLNAKSRRQLTAKCTKLCNLTHQTALFYCCTRQLSSRTQC